MPLRSDRRSTPRPHRPTRRRSGLFVRLALLVLLVAVSVAVGQPATAAAVDGATLTNETSFVVDDDGVVQVRSNYRMTNTQPNRSLGGGRYEYFFFTGMYAPLDTSATDVAVEVNGLAADFSVDQDGELAYVDVEFGYELRYQRTATIDVTYRIAGSAPRSEDGYARVNPAYVAFPVYGWGDAGSVDLTVTVPDGWLVDSVGDELDRDDGDGTDTYRADDVDEEWFAFFSARNDDRLDHRTITVEEHEFDIASWPGDRAWRRFAVSQVREGVPALERLVGTDWPISGSTEITEAMTVTLRGYAGYYDDLLKEIEVSEDLDDQTLLHELTHAWFNSTRISDRWLSEGLAEEVAARALESLGEELPDPRTNAEIRADWGAFDTFPLLDWEPAFGTDDGSVEDYGYSASHRVVRALWEELGDERMAEVLAAVVDRDRAYTADGDSRTSASIGWKEFLDLAEQVGGSGAIQDVYDDLVLDAAARRVLERRNELVAAFDELVDRGDTWDAPEWVRTAMASWRLDDGAERIARAGELLDARDELTDALEPLGLELPAGLEAEYESAGRNLDAVTERLDGLLAAADDLTATERDLAEQLEPLGLDLPALLQSDLDADPVELVDVRRDLVADAETASALAAELDELVESRPGTTVAEVDAGAFADDSTATIELLRARIAATEATIAAHDARDGADTIAELFGLVGSDIDERLDALDDALADDRFDEVNDASAAIVADVDELGAIGARRLTWSGAALGGLLTVIVVLLVRRRRRARASSDDGSGGVANGPLTPPAGWTPPAPTTPDPAPPDDPDHALAIVGDDAPAGHAADQADAGEAGTRDPG